MSTTTAALAPVPGEPIRVLEIVGNAIVGGMESCVERLIERLPRERFAVTALLPFEGAYADRLRARSAGKRIIGTQATITFDEGGINSSTASGGGHAAWSAVDNIVESPETLVLRRGRVTRLWLPKRALGSPAESSAILARMEARMSTRQMPPIATEAVDDAGIQRITRWVAELPSR